GDLDPDQPAEGCLGAFGDLPDGVVGDARQLRAQHPQPGPGGGVSGAGAPTLQEVVAGAGQLVDEATVLLELAADLPVASRGDLDKRVVALWCDDGTAVQQRSGVLVQDRAARLRVGREAVDDQQDVLGIAFHEGPLARGDVDNQRRATLLRGGSRVVGNDRGHQDDEHGDDPAEPAIQAQLAWRRAWPGRRGAAGAAAWR